ncbi:hypothetical protein D5086_017529 [Populus alba]|uniref:Uncharacterized protein n=1 Tax=Populus alba TaxID=43335 RepID=A0ACC4BML7_POPAL
MRLEFGRLSAKVQKTSNTQLRNLYIAGSVVGFILLLAALVVCRNYSIEDLKRVTDDFSEERKIGDQAYKGLKMDNAEMMIKLMRFEQTRQVIDILSKINHINILNLLGKDDVDGKSFKECIVFLGGKTTEGGCFDGLRSFMDPCLKEDYPLAEALCLTVLAKACVEEDPLQRPSMDDIIKVLVRMEDYPLAEAFYLAVLAKACVEENPLQRPSMDDIMKVLVRMAQNQFVYVMEHLDSSSS